MIMLMFNLMTKKRIKLNTTIISNGCVHTPADCKVIKCPFNKNKVATIKNILKTNKILRNSYCGISKMYSGADLMFLFKDVWSLIINRLSLSVLVKTFCSHQNGHQILNGCKIVNDSLQRSYESNSR